MTRLLTAPPVERRIRPNTDILVQPGAVLPIRRATPVVRRKRRINYAKKIQNDDFLMGI